MTASSGPPHSGHLGRGTVYIAFDGSVSLSHWSGYWDLEPDGPPTKLEEGPGWSSIRQALLWARERAPRVLVRIDDYSGYWWAGKGEAPADSAMEGVMTLSPE